MTVTESLASYKFEGICQIKYSKPEFLLIDSFDLHKDSNFKSGCHKKQCVCVCVCVNNIFERKLSDTESDLRKYM